MLLFLISIILYAVVNYKFITAAIYLRDDNPANDSRAVKLLEEAVSQDKDRKSAFLLGYFYKKNKYQSINMVKSHQYYLLASDWGDEVAKMLVAWNFYKGIGCVQDRTKSKSLLTELAIAGDDKAKEILKFVIMH